MPKANIAGGSATAGGINFQAAVTAIAEVHVAGGAALLWLYGIANDIPTAVFSESGGPGDDIRLLLQDGSAVEIQVKRNLSAGDRLWDPLLELARALHEKTIAYGLLIVSPDSSSTVRHDLAHDILRMGDGRSDGLKPIAQRFRTLLESAVLPVQNICSRLRIVTVHAFDRDAASVVAARAVLARLCADASQIGPAWDRLLHDATLLIEHRGQRTSIQVLTVLKSGGIRIEDSAAKASPLALLSALTRWAFEANASFTVFGVRQPLPLAGAWIPLAALELVLDLGVKIVLFVLGFPVPEWHSQLIEQRAVHVSPVFGGRGNFVFRNKHEVVRARPALEQILKCLTHDAFTRRAGNLPQSGKFIKVLLD